MAKKHGGYCPHRGPHQTGMELCRECGDYGICAECGLEYIKADSGESHCWMCLRIHALEFYLAKFKREQAERKALYQNQSV